jgi:hypothetical protein
MERNLIYPRKIPNAPSKVDGLGSSFSSGGEYPTDSIDYIKFTEVEVNYASGGGLSSVGPKENRTNGQSCYLYIPQNLSTDYGVQYSQISMGALGVEAASVIGSKSEQEITEALQAAAGSASPEALFNTMSTGIGGVNNVIGVGGGFSGSNLSAISQGLAFNPFMEQIFEGISFRNHGFSFKLIARNAEEAKEISQIVRFFKMAMLPSLDPGPTTGPAATGSSASSESTSPFIGRSTGSRYLKVPNRFQISFKRASGSVPVEGERTARISSTAITDIQGLYQFKECALTNVQVSYTPDNQYVSTNEGLVPAIQLDLRFVELSIITKQDFSSTSILGF